MSKRVKNLIIGLCVLVLLGVGIVAIYKMPSINQDEESSSGSTSSFITLKDFDEDQITKLTVKNKNAEFSVVPDGEEWKIEGFENVPYNSSTFTQLTSEASLVTADSLIEENASDLKKYGLDSPTAEFTIATKDGKTYQYLFGSIAPGDVGYYMMEKDGKDVYLSSTTTGETMQYIPEYFVDMTLTPESTDDDPLTLESIELAGTSREEPIKIKYIGEEERDEDEQVLSDYEMTTPLQGLIDVNSGGEFLASYFGQTASSVEKVNPTAAELKEYGFDTTYSSIKVKYGDTTETLKVAPCDDTYYWLMKDDIPVIYKVEKTNMPWAETQPHEMVNRLLFTPHIDTVDNITITNGDKTYSYDIGHKKETNSEGEETSTPVPTYEGKELDLAKFRKFYQVVIGATLEDVITTQKESGEPDVTLTYRYNTGEPDTKIEFYSVEGGRAIYKIDGESQFVIRQAYLDKLLKDCEKIINGEEIIVDW